MYQPPHNNKLTIVRFNRTIQAAAAAWIPRSSRGMAWWVLSSKKVASPAPYVFEGERVQALFKRIPRRYRPKALGQKINQ